MRGRTPTRSSSRTSNDIRNQTFRKATGRKKNGCGIHLEKFSISGLGGIRSEEFAFNHHKLVFLGDPSTGKTTILQLLQLALSGSLLDHPALLNPFCNDEEEPGAISLHFNVSLELIYHLKLLFICYTLALRFDLTEIKKDSANTICEHLQEMSRSETPVANDSFETLQISYQIEPGSLGKALTVTISSGELLWLHERLLLDPNRKQATKKSSDYGLRDKFLYDSLIINQHIPMKKNLSFNTKPSVQKATSKPTALKSSPVSDVDSHSSPDSQQEKKAHDIKKKKDISSDDFNWDSIKSSSVAGLLEMLPETLKPQQFPASPFRVIFERLLSCSSSFFYNSCYSRYHVPCENKMNRKTIFSVLEALLFARSLENSQQLKKMSMGLHSMIGYTFVIKISLRRIIERFLVFRENPHSRPILDLAESANQLFNTKATLLEKEVFMNCQLLLDREIEGKIILKKFEQLDVKYGFVDVLAVLNRLFQLPIVLSPEFPVVVELTELKTNKISFLRHEGTEMTHILMILVTVHRRVGGNLILDQPEGSLSAYRQSQIRRYVLSHVPAKHLLIVTSSPHMLPLDCIDCSIRFIKKEGEEIQRMQFLRSVSPSLTLSEPLLLDSEVKNVLFARNVLLVDEIPDIRLVTGLHSLLESEPDMTHTLEANLNRCGSALDIDQLLAWSVLSPNRVTGTHPLVLTFGYQIPCLVVASIVTSSGQTLTREVASTCAAFKHIRQVYGKKKEEELLNTVFQEVEGVRETLQKLAKQKRQSEALSSGEKTLLDGLESELRPQLNSLEGELRGNLFRTLANFGMHSWDNGVCTMVSKTPKAAELLLSSWLRHPLAQHCATLIQVEGNNKQLQAQQWLTALDTNPNRHLVWRYISLGTIKNVIRCLITEQNEEFLHFCATLSRKPSPPSNVPLLLVPQ